MRDEDFPGLFRGADIASMSAQKTYFGLQAIYLGTLIAGGIIGAATSLLAGDATRVANAVTAIVLIFGLLILWISRAERKDRAWFNCRAIAESARTASWRYMMCVPPFVGDDADQRFVEDLREIRKARPDCQKYLAEEASVTSCIAITRFMRSVRAKSLDERKQFYLDQRLIDQKSWYSKKAQQNARIGSRWFWVIVGLQVVAVVVAVTQAVIGGLGTNLVPVLMTVTAVIVAWNQMKRHDELATAYSLAAQELSELEVIAMNLTTEADFPQLIEQVEDTISREHTMWCARRDVPLGRMTDSAT